MRDVIDGLKNHSTREAKDFVVSRIVAEAQPEGTPLSELERKMLYVSVPEMSQAEAEFCAGFDRESDHDRYEQKIAGLIKKVESRYRDAGGESSPTTLRRKLRGKIACDKAILRQL